jgi:large subunit ribosomal protein L6
MSRIGKLPVEVAKGVTVKVEEGTLKIKGPKGELHFDINEGRYGAVNVAITDGSITVTRKEESKLARTQQGLVRSLIQNMVTGVTETFSKNLELVGVGYKADAKGKSLNLSLGFSHPIDFPLPEGISAAVDKGTKITISGADKQLVGEVAAEIRKLRPPEPYKGKGIRYEGETVRRKVGKAAAGATGG